MCEGCKKLSPEQKAKLDAMVDSITMTQQECFLATLMAMRGVEVAGSEEARMLNVVILRLGITTKGLFERLEAAEGKGFIEK